MNANPNSQQDSAGPTEQQAAAVAPVVALPSVSEFMREDLARSGLVPADIGAVSTFVGYRIPYYTLDGAQHPRMYRTRLAVAKAGRRYDQPSRDEIGDECTHPYIPPAVHGMDCTTLYICEGEKKAAAAIKMLGIPAIAIGGCQMWRAGENKVLVHPVLQEFMGRRAVKKVVIIPDDDVRRYNLACSYGTFAAQLQRTGREVVILDLPDKLDDLLVQWADGAKMRFADLPRLDPAQLVESPDYLARYYGLACRDKKDGVYVFPNESNVDKLLAEHPGFPLIWLNGDKDQVMFGDQPISLDHEGMTVVKFLQHNLSMPTVSAQTVHRALRHRAGLNRRSPFREWLEGLQWDGVPRLGRMFPTYCGTPDSPFVREVGTKWLPGAVWRVMQPGCPVDYMVITKGGQGIGKSTLPAILWGRENVVTTVGQEFQQKDNLSKHHMGKVVVVEEFDAMGLRDMAPLKALITNHVDTFRRPYAQSEERLPRSSVMYATTNQSRLLKRDDSGQRRFVVVEVAQVQFAELIRDREQLWAEAVHLWRQYTPETIFDLSNVAGATEAAQQYVHEESYIEQFKEWEAGALADPSQHVVGPRGRLCIARRATEIYMHAGLDRGAEESKRRLVDHILGAGWQRLKGSVRVADKLGQGGKRVLTDPFVRYV